MSEDSRFKIRQKSIDERKLDIVLINPALPLVEEHAGNCDVYPHIGIVQVATVIRDELRKTLEGWDINVEVLDQNISPRPILEVLDADIVGVSMLSATAAVALKILEEAKARGAFTVLGNDTATLNAHSILESNSTVDVVIKGDYPEKPFKDLILAVLDETTGITDIAGIPGLSFANTNSKGDIVGVSHSHPVPYPPDDIPFADLSLIPPEDVEVYIQAYQKKFAHCHEDPKSIRPTILNIAQGCDRGRNPCRFCGIGDLRLRNKSVDNVFKEIKANFALGYNYFYIIADDLTSFADTLLNELCKRWDDELGDIAGQIQFFVYAKADSLVTKPGSEKPDDLPEPIEEIWDYFKKMRVHRVNIGFESGDNLMLRKGLGKSASVCQNGRVVGLLKERGIQLHTSMVVGGLGETEESLKNTIAFLECILEDSVKEDGHNNIIEVDTSVLMPVPGSIAWRMMTDADFAISEIEKFNDCLKKTRYNASRPVQMIIYNKTGLQLLAAKWLSAETIDPKELANDWITYFTNVCPEILYAYISWMRRITKEADVIAGGSF